MTTGSKAATRLFYIVFLLLLTTGCFSLVIVHSAFSHPLDDLTIRTINQYFVIDARGKQPNIWYLLKMAEIPSFEEMNKIDPDYSRDVTEEEVKAYLDQRIPELYKKLHFTVDDAPVDLKIIERHLDLQKGKGGLNVINLHLKFRPQAFVWPNVDQRIHVVLRSDNFREVFGERECKLIIGGRFEDQTSTPGTDITSGQNVISRDEFNNVIYQSDNGVFTFNLLPLPVKSVTTQVEPSFDWIVKTQLNNTSDNGSLIPPQQETGFTQTEVTQDDQVGFIKGMYEEVTSMIRAKELTFSMFITGMVITLFLGMAHAWSPGHGKTIMAAYLIGERGTVWNAIVLGVVVAITHTWSVLGLGVVILSLQDYISSEQLNFWLSVVSAAIIIAIGVTLFLRRYASWVLVEHMGKGWHNHQSEHHSTGSGHDHGHHGHSHVIKNDDGTPPSIWSILGLGISGGIVPCPSALIVLLLAIQFQRLSYGLWLILSFSIGLALVLIVLGVIIVRAATVMRKITGGGKTLAILPVVSSGLITILGLTILAGTLIQYGFLVIRF